MSQIVSAEYIWIDGAEPTKKLRSKAKVLVFNKYQSNIGLIDCQEWSFDGSSTNQALGDNSDLILKPVRAVKNPLREKDDLLVMCEVLNPDRTPHKTNTRAKLRETLNDGGSKLKSWWGFEQEYVLYKNRNILGWPTSGYPNPQGPYYCGVGSDEVIGREIIEEHLKACLDAGLLITGINAEVMLGQWEFQIGYRENSDEATPLLVSDHMWLARWLLYRICEKYKVYARLDPKPKRGDWNGSGCHVNVSTVHTRENGGKEYFKNILSAFDKNHMKHMEVYGHGNRMRMTGKHETSKYEEFTWKRKDDIQSMIGSRSSSVRIPPMTVDNYWRGHFEDRRPAANVDPYEACNVILNTLMSVKE